MEEKKLNHLAGFNEIESFQNSRSAANFLREVTGHNYVFAVASSQAWGLLPTIEEEEEETEQYEEKQPRPNVRNVTCYQLMPDTVDDGFFDWYCYERDYYQFFQSREMCAAYFLKFWIIWDKLGRPKPF